MDFVTLMNGKMYRNIGFTLNKAIKLVTDIPVFGGGDASLIGIGAGCVETGDTHIYLGTSGWVSTIVDKQRVDAGKMIAAIVGAQSERYNYFAEMETAGKCLEWVKDHLALFKRLYKCNKKTLKIYI